MRKPCLSDSKEPKLGQYRVFEKLETNAPLKRNVTLDGKFPTNPLIAIANGPFI